jgi:hypothetical protein
MENTGEGQDAAKTELKIRLASTLVLFSVEFIEQ